VSAIGLGIGVGRGGAPTPIDSIQRRSGATAQAYTGSALTTVTIPNVQANAGDLIMVCATWSNTDAPIIGTVKWGASNIPARVGTYIGGGVAISYMFTVLAPSTATLDIVFDFAGMVAPLALAMSAEVFAVLSDALPDKTAFVGNPAASTTPSCPATATTTQAHELVVTYLATRGPVTDAAGTWGDGFTDGVRGGTTSGVASECTISTAWKVVNATGAYGSSKTGITSRFWNMAIATLKAA
jgi:hypothetical protein